MNKTLFSPHLDLLYQDENIFVIYKPAGLLCHPVGHSQGDTIISRVQHYFGKEARLVHRLDQGTSGIMIVARNMLAAQLLYKQFSRRTIQKEYLALVYGCFPYEKGQISFPISTEKNPSSVIKIKMKNNPLGLPSITEYQLIKNSERFSLLRLVLHTGRRHQIRIHLASLGYSILGEPLYFRQGLPFLWEYYFLRKSPWSLDFKGMALHAHQISFQHPFCQKKMLFHAAPPKEWHIFLEDLKVSYPFEFINQMLV